ncbi:hypothetical protein ABPG72_014855 [Tetrahymena utriculariae]
MNLLENKRRAVRSISEYSFQKQNLRYQNQQEEPSFQDNQKSYLNTSSFISMPKGNFFDSRKSQSIIHKQHIQSQNKSLNDILKLNAKVKEDEEKNLQKTRNIISNSIVRDYAKNPAQIERSLNSRSNNNTTYQTTRVQTTYLRGLSTAGTAGNDVKFMKFYNFEDFLEKTKLQILSSQQTQQQNQTQMQNQQKFKPKPPIASSYQAQIQQQQQPQYTYQNRGVLNVQKAYLTSLTHVRNKKIQPLTLQQKQAVSSAEDYYKYLSQRDEKINKNEIGQDNNYALPSRQPSLDQIYEKVFQEQKQEEEQYLNSIKAKQNQKQKQQNSYAEAFKMNTQPKQTQVQVLKLNDNNQDQQSQISEENSFEMESSIKDNVQKIKFHKIQVNDKDKNQPEYYEEYMKEIKVSVRMEHEMINIEAELGKVEKPEIVSMQIQIFKECPFEFQTLEFEEVYELTENPNIKYIKCFNNQKNREEVIELFECQNINSHLYYFKNLILRFLLQNKGITPNSLMPSFALSNSIVSNKIIIINVFPILIPLESIIHFRYFAKKPFPEKQLLTMMKTMIFQIKYLYENYRLSVGQINTESIYLDFQDYQLKFFNLSSASIHILPTRISQFWNSNSLIKDCQELGQCFFMLKNLMTQERMSEKSDSYQKESIQELEDKKDQFSSEIILELLKIQKVSSEAENQRQEYDPFRRINFIFEKQIKDYQLEVIDLDFKNLDIFMNARILKDNQTFSLYYEKTLQPIKSLAYKKIKTPSEKLSELKACLENWKIHLKNKEFESCEKYGDYYIQNVDQDEMNDKQKLKLANIFSKQGGVKIVMQKYEQGRSYLQQGLTIYNSLNQRYTPECVMIIIELAKLDLIYENQINCESAASYLLELYFAQLLGDESQIEWEFNLVTQILELLSMLASKLNIYEVQPFFYEQIINQMKIKLESQSILVKSNTIVDYYIKSADCYQECSNLKEAAKTLEKCVKFAENDQYLEKIASKQSQVLQEAREIAQIEQVNDGIFEKIEEFRNKLTDSLNPYTPNYLSYNDIFEQYFNYIISNNIQTDEQFISDLTQAASIVGGNKLKQPQKAQKYLLKVLEKLFQSEKYSQEELKTMKLDIYEKIGLYSFEQDQDLLALMWFLVCIQIRIQDLNNNNQYDELYFNNLNQISKCSLRLKYNYVYIIIQKTIVLQLKNEQEQLKVLTNITKMNIEIANLTDGFQFNELAKTLAEKLKDFSTLQNIQTYRLSLISKIPDSEEAKQYLQSLKANIEKIIQEGQLNEAIQQYQEYFKIIEAQKDPNYNIQTVEDYNEYADLIWKQGNKKQAMTQFKKGLKVQIKLFGLNEPNTLKNIQNVGILYYELEMHEQALILFEDILKTLRRSKTYNTQYFQALEYEANIYKQQKNVDQSLVCLHELRDVIQKFPPKNPQFNNKLQEISFEIGKLYSEQRKFYEAEPYFREALKIKAKLQSNDANIIIQKYLYEYSQCLFQVGNSLEAQNVFKEQVETWKRLRTIKPNQMQMYLDDYHELFLNYSRISNMFDILSEIKHNFEQKNVKTNIQTNEFYKALCVKLAEIETHYQIK